MWKPWKYEERIKIANEVDKFKKSLSEKQLKEKQLKDRGQERPLDFFGHFQSAQK